MLDIEQHSINKFCGPTSCRIQHSNKILKPTERHQSLQKSGTNKDNIINELKVVPSQNIRSANNVTKMTQRTNKKSSMQTTSS